MFELVCVVFLEVSGGSFGRVTLGCLALTLVPAGWIFHLSGPSRVDLSLCPLPYLSLPSACTDAGIKPVNFLLSGICEAPMTLLIRQNGCSMVIKTNMYRSIASAGIQNTITGHSF